MRLSAACCDSGPRRLGHQLGRQEVNDSARWLNAQLSCEMPEHELLSTDPWQPPLSRWIAQMDSRPSEWSRAKLRIRCAPES